MTLPEFVIVAGSIAVASMSTAWWLERRYAVLAGIAGALAVMAVNAQLYMRFYADDGYITLRYARNLADGAGPVWNPGERVEGYTSFLWMLLLAAAHVVGADLVDASIVLGYVCMAGLLVVIWRTWATWAEEEGGLLAHPAVLIAALLVIGFNDALVYWGFSGMEVSLAALTMTGTVFLFLRESRVVGVPWSALAASAAAMTRPEMIVLAAVTGAFTAWEAFRDRDRDQLRRLVAWVALFGATFGAYYAWRWAYYGYPFPNTYYAKVGSSLDFAKRGIEYVRAYGALHVMPLFLAGCCGLLAAATARVRADAIYVLAVIGTYVAVVIMEGGDAFGHARFLAPMLPTLYVAGVSGGAVVLGKLPVQQSRAAAVGLAIAALAALSFMQSAADSTIPDQRKGDGDRRELGRWIHEHVPRDFVVATFASGAVPYYGGTRGLDLFGLTDETIAHTDVPDFGEGLAGHEKYNIDYVLHDVRPELIVLSDADFRTRPRDVIEGVDSGIPGRDNLLNDDETWAAYGAAAVRLERGWYNFLVRKDIEGSLPLDWVESRDGPDAPSAQR